MRGSKRWALASVMILCAAACSAEPDKAEGGADTASAPSSKTLAAAIGDEGDLDALDAVIRNAGLSAVLEGRGPYTVFAPVNSALQAAGPDLAGETMKAQSAALLRAHIVPGALTRADILAAIDRGGAAGARMRTMADGLLTFSKDGDAVVITAADGAVARLAGDETVAENGVVQPVNGLLIKAN